MSDPLPINNTDVPLAYIGAWRKQNTDAEEIWLQTQRLHASICIPMARPDFSGRAHWDDFSDADLHSLAHQGGVAGACIAQHDILHRRRQIDYLPRRGETDLRRMQRQGLSLFEETLDKRKPAEWHLLAGSENEIIALRFQDAGVGSNDDQRKGYLLIVGAHFLFVRDRAVVTQQAESLALLAEYKGLKREQLIALLDFEISYGLRADNNQPWIIQRSTLPQREGRPLLDNPTLQKVAYAGAHQPHPLRWGGKPFLRYWSLDQWQPAATTQDA